jgi:glycosyltransferase involved in cell wall biosynthesis
MSAGCVTLGFHGNGGKEFLKAPYGFPIETNDVLAMATTMEHLLKRFEEDPESISLLQQESSNFIQQNYSLEREKESILTFWKSIV